jgi:hypothetical protein
MVAPAGTLTTLNRKPMVAFLALLSPTRMVEVLFQNSVAL